VPAPDEASGPANYETLQNPEKGTDWKPAPYEPPGSYIPPGGQTKRRALPWVVGIGLLMLVGIVGLTMLATVFLPRLKRNEKPSINNGRVATANSNANPEATNDSAQPNSNVSAANANVNANANAVSSPENANTNDNANSNRNANTNSNSNGAGTSAAPFDKDQVLAQLTELEHEWTVANLNADKKALARILADDYVGSSPAGMQGKVDYINSVQRDTTIERWDFQDLKVTLHGDRATLAGKLKLVVQGQERIFRFVDKFVWRDGRWQATGSEVNLVQ
jgi:hypothetical protein